MPERHNQVTRAVVLAAGTGSRLVSRETLPKPLKIIAGVPLLVRVLRTLRDEGIREAVIVTGYQGDKLRRALAAEPSLDGMSLIFAENERYDLKNGVSLLAARDHVVQGTILTMADHLYSPEVVRSLKRFELPDGASALAVDYDIDRCFDLEDATKVRVDGGRITDIGKELPAFEALDTGVFRIGPALCEELGRLFDERGDCSLSEGVRALADKGRFYACNVGDARWIDVDTPAALAQAEQMLHEFGDALDRGSKRLPGGALEIFPPTWLHTSQTVASTWTAACTPADAE